MRKLRKDTAGSVDQRIDNAAKPSQASHGTSVGLSFHSAALKCSTAVPAIKPDQRVAQSGDMRERKDREQRPDAHAKRAEKDGRRSIRPSDAAAVNDSINGSLESALPAMAGTPFNRTSTA